MYHGDCKEVSKLLTQTDFAKERGVSRQRIGQKMDLLRAGGAVSDNGKIRPELAHQILDGTLDVRMVRSNKKGDKLEQCAIENTDKGVGKSDEQPGDLHGIDDNLPFQEALRRKEIVRLKDAQLDYDKKAGALCDAEGVKRAGFDEGRRLRDAILNVPDQIAAIVAAEADEFKVHSILMSALKGALRGVADGV